MLTSMRAYVMYVDRQACDGCSLRNVFSFGGTDVKLFAKGVDIDVREIPRRPLIIHGPWTPLLIFHPWNWIMRVSSPPAFVRWLITRGQGIVFFTLPLPSPHTDANPRNHPPPIPTTTSSSSFFALLLILRTTSGPSGLHCPPATRLQRSKCKDHNLSI